MTTNSEGSQPNPGDQLGPDAAAIAAAAAAAAAQQTPAEPEPAVDIDQAEVDAAKAAAEAEKAAGGGDGTTAADTGTPGQQQPAKPQDQQQQPAGQQQQPAGDAVVMIPKARLDEALARGDKLGAEASYWKGVADARAAQQQQPQGGQQQQPGVQQQQQPTTEQRLAAIQAEQDALAKKFDDGEITMSDLTRQQRELNNREQAIREEVLTAKLRPADTRPDQNAVDNTLYLDTLTAQLEVEHPWVAVIDQTVGDKSPEWRMIKERAIENLVARGIDPTKKGTGQYELRKEFATLADQLGPALIGDRAKAKGIAIPGQAPSQGGQQQQQPALSPQAKARAAALAKAEGAPPNLQRMSGVADDGTGVPTDSRLEHMTDDEIGALPDATRRRLLGTIG